MTIIITRSSVLEPEQKLSELEVGSALDTDTIVIVRDGTVPDFRVPVSTIRTGLPGPPGPAGPPGAGSVTQVDTGTGLTGGPITTTGTVALADVPTATIKGRLLAGTGASTDLTGTQATTLLDVFTPSLKGLVPASGGGTTNFLRADGAFSAPPGGLPPAGAVSQKLTTSLLNGVATAAWETDLQSVSVKDFGAIADYNSHPLSALFGSLAAAQAVYPWVDDLTPEVDYCAIQSAIDYAYNNSFCAIINPRGLYRLSAPIFVDAPLSLRAQGTYPRWNPATAYPTPGTIIQYNGIPWISLIPVPAGNAPFFATVPGTPSNGGLVTPGSTYWEFYYSSIPGGTQRSALNAVFPWKPTFMGEPGQYANAATPGSWGTFFVPNYVNAHGIIMGVGNGGTAQDFGVYFYFQSIPSGVLLKGGQDPHGCGVAVSNAGGGASVTLLRNIAVQNCYAAFSFGGLGNGGLGDNNVLERCVGGNTYYFYVSSSSQTFINELYSCKPNSTIGIATPRGVISVFGGNWSAEEEGSPAAAFNISSTSALSFGSGSGYWPFGGIFQSGATYLLMSTTVASPDASLIASSYTDGRFGVYNWFVINTASYGPVPFIVFPGGFNSSTNVLSLMVAPPWLDTFISDKSTFTFTQMQAELQVATKIYAACVVFPFQCSVAAYGAFFENANTSMCLNSNQSYGPSLFSSGYYDADPALAGYAPQFSPSDFALAHYYAQKTIPFVYLLSDVIFDSVEFGNAGSPIRDPVIVYGSGGGNEYKIVYRNATVQSASGFVLPMVFWNSGTQGPFYTQSGPQFGAGSENNLVADSSPNWPTWVNLFASSPALNWARNGGVTRTDGIRPSKHTIPPLLLSDFNIIAYPQSLPAISSTDVTGIRASCGYPLIYGGTPYQTGFVCPTQLVNWFGGKPGNYIFESSHDCYSYHQNLSDVGGPGPGFITGLSWSARGKTWVVHLDSNTITFMFAGLVIGLTTVSDLTGTHPTALNYYLVTGVYPGLGFITVWTVNCPGQYIQSSYISGTLGTVYTGTVINSQPYRVKILAGPAFYATTTYTAICGQEVMADTTSAPWTLTLPINPLQNDKVVIRDPAGTWASNNLTIAGNGANINSSGSNLVENTNNATVTAIYINPTIGWKTY